MLAERKPDPSARALYLGSRDHKKIGCTAEALVVQNSLNQTRRYPLARISRIVSSATACDWTGEALALCMRNHITISWLDNRGNTLGTIYPAVANPPAYAVALEVLLESEIGRETYNHWLRARRMEVLVYWGKHHTANISPAQWQHAKHHWVYGASITEHLPHALHQQCHAWTGAQLSKWKLPPHYWDGTAQQITLQHDLCNLQWAEMNLCAGSLADKTSAEETLTTIFERWNTVHGASMTLHISSLCRLAMRASL